jgi:hypothetical protein
MSVPNQYSLHPTAAAARDAHVLNLRHDGKSMRRIAYLTRLPVSTVGDICKREYDGCTEPMPYYTLVDY